MIPLSSFNQRLAKSVQGDGVATVIIHASGSPSRLIQCTAPPLSTHERLPQFHSWSSSATTDIYWLAVVCRELGQVQKKKARREIPPKDLKGRKSGTIKASDLPPNCAGHRTKANRVALIKKDALDQPYFQVALHEIFFPKCKKMIPIQFFNCMVT